MGVHIHCNAQIRRALTPLSKVAERTGAAVVVVMHLNQATLQPALYRVQGTIGYVGAARSVLLVVADKEEPDAPFQGLIQRRRHPCGYHVARFQYPGADGAYPEGTRAITKRDRFSGVTYDVAWYAD